MLFIGQFVAVPLLTFGSHIIGLIPFLHEYTHVRSSHIAQLVPSSEYKDDYINVFPSYWVAQTIFFFSYLITNAFDVFSMEPVSDSPTEEWRVNNRRHRASTIMGIALFMALFMVVIRWYITGAETLVGTIWGILLFGAAGVGWYTVATLAGARKGDVFGIVQQMIPIPDDTNITICTPPTV